MSSFRSCYGTVQESPIPPSLVRRYGLYSSRARGTWKDRPALCTRAPVHWYGRQAVEPPTPTDALKDQHLSTPSSRKARARLLAKVYELDVMACPQCRSRMAVIAVILDPAEIRRITACLARHGRGPPTVG
jgi:hypothetical protein